MPRFDTLFQTKILLDSDPTTGKRAINLNREVLLLDYLVQRFTYHSLQEWIALLDSGNLKIDNIVASESTSVKHGQQLDFLMTDYEEPEVPLDWKIISRQEDLVFVHKPAGMPVHRTGKIFTQTLERLVSQSENAKLYLLHRLDQDSSGIVAFATQHAGHWAPSAKGVQWKKCYLGIGRNIPPNSEGVIGIPLGEKIDSAIRCQMHSLPIEQGGKHALTAYQVVDSQNGHTLIAFYPITGRKHQIRAHCSLLGFPLLGDKIYSFNGRHYLWNSELESARGSKPDPDELGAPHHLLHAVFLKIERNTFPPCEAVDEQYPVTFPKWSTESAKAWVRTKMKDWVESVSKRANDLDPLL